ncbi:hypothetical protein ACG2LH_03325 [Zhouia sp. PK063]|uniref:hypothetical protein n=1 Tax=Zhouia sp. PK063 TaxID=3373602 RepID=UPI0037A0FB54
MERIFDLEREIRDSLLINISIKLDFFSIVEKCILLTFRRSDESLFKVSFLNPIQFDYFEDDFSSCYIGHLKCLQTEDNIQISLDPFDERINEITEEDNFKIICENYIISEI